MVANRSSAVLPLNQGCDRLRHRANGLTNGRAGLFPPSLGARRAPPARKNRAPPANLAYLERSLHAPALWRRGEVQLDRLAAGARARLNGEFLQAGLEDERRDPLGAVDADSGAEHPAARAVATRVVRCQSEGLGHGASAGGGVSRIVYRFW